MKLKKQKIRMKITDSINEKLDGMEEKSALDIYKARNKEEVTDDFVELVGKDIYFEKENKEIKQEKRNENGKVIVWILLGVIILILAIITVF